MRIRKIVLILVNGSCFFRFLPGVFRGFDTRLFLWKCQKRHFRNVTSPKDDEHLAGSTFSNFDLIGCESTKKCEKSTILNIKVEIRKFKCHQNIPWVRLAGTDISNYGLILNRNGARDQKIIMMKKFNFILESAVMIIRP